MKYELVVFDIAGTTIIDKGNINKAFAKTFESNGFHVSEADINTVMGYEKKTAIRELNNRYDFGLSEDLIHQLHESFTQTILQFYAQGENIEAQPYAVEMFEYICSKNIKIALNTGFSRKITDAILHHLHWDNHPFISSVVASDEVAEGRPAPFMIQKIMQQLNITDPFKIVKIGDTEADIAEGKNAQCGFVVGITTGSYTREQLQPFSPDRIIDSLLEIQEFIV